MEFVNMKEDRKQMILAAAERCFCKNGFHQSSMHDICREAGMSPGALYRYFAGKEELIEAFAEKDMKSIQPLFQDIEKSDDIIQGFMDSVDKCMALEYSPAHMAMCGEILAEAARNPRVKSIFDKHYGDFERMLKDILLRARKNGVINKDLDLDSFIAVICSLGDGLNLRLAIDENFDSKAAAEIIKQWIRASLRPDNQKSR